MIDKILIEQIINKIQKYDSICLFTHEIPDFDALGSIYALQQWINDNFKNKEVYLMVPLNQLKTQDHILFDESKISIPSISTIQQSLGIVLDTANEARILTKLHRNCNELIAIDHHPKTESIGQIQWIDPFYPATCQMLAEMFLFLENKNVFNAKVAQYLYAGILTDTNNFINMNVLPSTYNIIANLVSKGINRHLVHDASFLETLQQKKFYGYVINKIHFTNNSVAYAVINKRASVKYNMQNIPSMSHALNNLTNIEAWVTLLYDFNFKKWKASIRSREVHINNIAREFGGGGHLKMAAVVFDKKIHFYKLVARLDQYLHQLGYINKSAEKQKRWNCSGFFVWFYKFFVFKINKK